MFLRKLTYLHKLCLFIVAASFLSNICIKDVSAYTPAYPLKKAADPKARYLIDQNNVPFFINGDTPWSLIGQVSNEDADLYLADAKAKGFNSVIITLVESHYANNAPKNYYGIDPYLTYQNGTPKFDTPNEIYFTHADWVINKAAEYGLNVILAPNYLGCCGDGYYDELNNSLNTTTVATNYGTWIGNRYKNFPNIIYVWGDDINVSGTVKTKVAAMAAAVKAADPNHLHTYHAGPENSAADIFLPSSYPWLDLNTVYTYNAIQDMTFRVSTQSYNNNMPFIMFESHYERDWNNAPPLQVRWQAYVSVLSGAGGHHYGNNPIWHMNSTSLNGITDSWKNHLNDEARVDMKYFRALFESRDWTKLVPDQNHSVVTSGYGSGNNYVGSARTNDGATVIAYLRSNYTITLNMGQISGSGVKAWWFNPRDGTNSLIGTFANSGSRTFTPSNSLDWVLVLDNADLNLPAPGSSNSGTPTPTVFQSPTATSTIRPTSTITAAPTSTPTSSSNGSVKISYTLNRTNVPDLYYKNITFWVDIGSATVTAVKSGTSDIPYQVVPGEHKVYITTPASNIDIYLSGTIPTNIGQTYGKAALKDNKKWAWSHGMDDNVNLWCGRGSTGADSCNSIAHFDSKGYRATVYLITNIVDTVTHDVNGSSSVRNENWILDEGQIQDLITKGWGIGNHDNANSCSNPQSIATANAILSGIVTRSTQPNYKLISFAAPNFDTACDGYMKNAFGLTASDGGISYTTKLLIDENGSGVSDDITTENFFTGSSGVQVLSSANNIIKLYREGKGYDAAYVKSRFDYMSTNSNSTTHRWFNTLTHSDGAAVKDFVNYFDIRYGTNGTKEAWMAPSDEIYSYLLTSNKIAITFTGSSNTSPTPSTNNILGDANEDGKVDGADYIIWLNHYEQNFGGVSNGDFNLDSKIDGADYIIWLNHYSP